MAAQLLLSSFIIGMMIGFQAQTNVTTKSEGKPMQISLKSSAFAEGEMIPKVHSSDGKDISPALSWSGVPSGCRSIALICDDPDAPVGTWVHWVIFNIPANATALPEGVPKDKVLADASRQGGNDFRRIGYDGPSPPAGPAHRYFFKIYALDTTLDLQPGVSKKELLKAMEGHILAEGQLMGKYKR